MLQYDSKPIPLSEYEGSLCIGKTYRLFSPLYSDQGLVLAYRCHQSGSVDRSKLRDPPHHRFDYPDRSIFVINDTEIDKWKIALARPAEFSAEQRYHDQERSRVTKEHRAEDRDIKAKKLLQDLEEAYTCVIDDDARCRYVRKFSVEEHIDDRFYALRSWLAYAGSNAHKQIATEFFTPAKLKLLDQTTLSELKKKCGIEYTPAIRREKKVRRNQDTVPDSWEDEAAKLTD